MKAKFLTGCGYAAMLAVAQANAGITFNPPVKSSGSGMGWVIFGVVAVALVGRLFAGGGDENRIRSYIKERGGRLVTCEWSPFGKGWWGEKNDRIYDVCYIDRDGNSREATCKTSMFSGVYFTEDRISRPAQKPMTAPIVRPSMRPPAQPQRSVADLEQENRRLREEIERLKREDSDPSA